MEDRLEGFLSYCSKMDFGPVTFSDREKELYRAFNKENILLCQTLPESIQKEALLFLKRYSGISDDQEPNFFKNYYTPAWSIIYWLTESRYHNNDLSQEDIKNAITAHSMAMSLHSIDDHLNDREIPATHLTLLLRSQSWMMMNTALTCLATGVDGGTEIVENLINDYYYSICGPEAIDSLDSYANLFRKQMATWLIVPVLLSQKTHADKESADAVQTAYGSFGIAWRLLDDIQDIEKDMLKGTHSAIYICLPEKIKNLWDKIPREESNNTTDYTSGILEYILANGIVDRVKERACREMESAASIADDCHMKGLGDEFRCLVRPLKISRNHLINGNVEDKSRPGVSKKNLSIEVTTHCNSACTHCFVRAGLAEPSSLPVDVVKNIISEGYNLDYRNLHVTGGEPLLWEGLFDTLDYAFDLGYKSVFLNTNGTMLTKEVSNRFASYDGLALSVSLEGRESLHDSVRGDGSYRQAVKGIEQALDAGIDLIIYTTARKSLLPDLPGFVMAVYKNYPGINHITLIQLIRVKDDIFDLSNELLDPDDFIKLVKMVSLLNVFGHKVVILNNPLVAVASKMLKIWGTPKSVPLHRVGDLVIMANRNITPAHSTHHSLGRYEKGVIEKALSSGDYRIAVAPDKKTCPSCKYSRHCMENGMVRPSQWFRNVDAEVLYCQRVLDETVL